MFRLRQRLQTSANLIQKIIVKLKLGELRKMRIYFFITIKLHVVISTKVNNTTTNTRFLTLFFSNFQKLLQ